MFRRHEGEREWLRDGVLRVILELLVTVMSQSRSRRERPETRIRVSLGPVEDSDETRMIEGREGKGDKRKGKGMRCE